jgi:hypothetical protein
MEREGQKELKKYKMDQRNKRDRKKKISRVSSCGICGGQSGTGTGFFPEYFSFTLSISFHRCSITWKN